MQMNLQLKKTIADIYEREYIQNSLMMNSLMADFYWHIMLDERIVGSDFMCYIEKRI